MEGEVRIVRLYRHLLMVGAGLTLFCAPGLSGAQAPAPAAPAVGQAELNLRKSVNTREFRGQEVKGEDRQIGRGDTLWRILVEEKGLSGKKFRSYLVVIRGLNPQVKNLDVLRVGDKIFIPLRVDQLLEERPATEAAASARPQPSGDITTNYRVKAGEHLYQILREQLKITDDRKLAQYYALVKDLNPERKNWDTLLEGDILRLPVLGRGQEITARAPPPVVESKRPTEPLARAEVKSMPEAQPTAEVKPTAEMKPTPEAKPKGEAKASAAPKPAPADRRPSLRAPATENMTLFATVVEAMGGEMQQSGEEVVVLKEGTVRFDRSSYPVVYSPALGQKVVIDPNDKIPASLRTKLGDPTLATQVLPMASGLSIQEAVSQLLARLGYQSLPADRPVVVQEEGIAFEAKGNWIALAPEQSNRTQEIVVINLAEQASEIPDYLKAQLAKKGLHLRDVAYASSTNHSPAEAPNAPKELAVQVKNWPRDKREMVDSLLLSFGITFGVAETLSVELRDGLRVDARTDRVFEQSGKRTAVFFQRADPEIKRALQDKQGVRAVELDIGSLSSRELIDKVLNMLGHQASYREHRFAAANGSAQDRLTVTAWGFHLPQRSMFVTDRRIPAALYRFFFEKGLEI
ncbi:MAG TPA: hypothetical protein VGK77_23255, partial [Candidatus Binatia bacterium]